LAALYGTMSMQWRGNSPQLTGLGQQNIQSGN